MADNQPCFWRDARLPHLELRLIEGGCQSGYALHSHVQWSLGAVTAGESTFHYRQANHHVHAGSLVLMNPEWVHACNPIANQPWAYRMLYVDIDWLTKLRHEAGLIASPCWQDISTAVITTPRWYTGYLRMTNILLASQRNLYDKQNAARAYLLALMHHLSAQPTQQRPPPSVLLELATYLDEHASDKVSLDTLCARSGYSPGHLIRAFKQYFNLTPHAYLINRRIQLGQRALKQGEPIADAALRTGFSDQSHFQRTFKRLVAATPHQYRHPLVEQ